MNWKETFYTGKREHPPGEEACVADGAADALPAGGGDLSGLPVQPDMGVVHGHPEQRCAAHSVRHCHVTASLNDTALGELKVGEPYSLNGTGKLTLHMAGDAQYA